jgi:hypothetical protein
MYGAFPDIRYYHNLVIAVLTELDSIGLPLAHRMITPKLEAVAEAIYDGIDDGSITAIENLPQMTYTFQPIEWGAFRMFGFFLTLEDIKIRRDRSANSPFLTNLVAYYKLGETSGTRVDSYTNGLDLTDVNTVGGAAGIIGGGADFIAANNEALIIPDANKSSFQFPNQSYTFSFWFNADVINVSSDTLLGIYPSSASERQYWFSVQQNVVNFFHWDSAQAQKVLQKISFGYYFPDQWYFVAGVYDHAGQEIRLYVNDLTVVTLSVTTGASSATEENFTIGSRKTDSTYDLSFDGTIDEIGVWNRALTAAEVATLYNSGAGLSYPFLGT